MHRVLFFAGLLAACGPPLAGEAFTLRAAPGARGVVEVTFSVVDPRGRTKEACGVLSSLGALVNGEPLGGPDVDRQCGAGPCTCSVATWASVADAGVAEDGLMHVVFRDGTAEVRVELPEPRSAALPTLVGSSTVVRGTERVVALPEAFTAPCAGSDDASLRFAVGTETAYVECGPKGSCTPVNTMSVVREGAELRFTVPGTFPVTTTVANVAQFCHPKLRACGFGGGCDVTAQNSARISLSVQ